ncbi:MAG: transporter substrate-binding domain-containing protein [Devosia sp.]
MKNWIKAGLASLALLAGGAAPAFAEDLDTILSSGTLRAGLCLTSEPAGFRDGEGNLKGYDVDAANLMAEALGVKLEVVEVTGPTRIPMLLSNKIDVIVCNITATTERARSINFSFPYLRTGIKLLIQKDSGIKGFEDIGAGKKFIVGRGTTGEAMAKARSPEAELVYVDNTPDAITLMRQGKADAYIEDSLGVDYIAKAYPDQLAALPDTYSSDPITFGVRKGNPEFLRFLDLFASIYVSSGKYGENYAKWWGEAPPPLTPVW